MTGYQGLEPSVEVQRHHPCHTECPLTHLDSASLVGFDILLRKRIATVAGPCSRDSDPWMLNFQPLCPLHLPYSRHQTQPKLPLPFVFAPSVVDAVAVAAAAVVLAVAVAAVSSEDAEMVAYLPWDCPTENWHSTVRGDLASLRILDTEQDAVEP